MHSSDLAAGSAQNLERSNIGNVAARALSPSCDPAWSMTPSTQHVVPLLSSGEASLMFAFPRDACHHPLILQASPPSQGSLKDYHRFSACPISMPGSWAPLATSESDFTDSFPLIHQLVHLEICLRNGTDTPPHIMLKSLSVVV